MARVNTVRCGLLDRSVPTMQKAASATTQVGIIRSRPCGQTLMNAPTRPYAEASRVSSPRPKYQKASQSEELPLTHSLTLSNTDIWQPPKPRLKGTLQRRLPSLVSMPNTLKEDWAQEPRENSLLPTSRCCGGLPRWDQQLSQTLCKRCNTSHGTFQEGNQPFKICIRVVLLVVFFNYIVRFCTIKTIMLLGIQWLNATLYPKGHKCICLTFHKATQHSYKTNQRTYLPPTAVSRLLCRFHGWCGVPSIVYAEAPQMSRSIHSKEGSSFRTWWRKKMFGE